MKIARTYDERIALIKEIAERKKKMQKIKAKSKNVLRSATRVNKKREYADVPTESNIYAYTDASKYAKEYYGEVMHETTRFDNDWD